MKEMIEVLSGDVFHQKERHVVFARER